MLASRMTSMASTTQPSREAHALDQHFARQRLAWWRSLRPLLMLVLGLTVVDLAGTINVILIKSSWPPDAPWLGQLWDVLPNAQLGAAVLAGLSLAHAYSLPPEYILSHSNAECYAMYRRAVRGAVYGWLAMLQLVPPVASLGVSLASSLGDPFPMQTARLALELAQPVVLFVFAGELLSWLVLRWPRRGLAWHAVPALTVLLLYGLALKGADAWRDWLGGMSWIPGGMFSLLASTALVAVPALSLALWLRLASRRPPAEFIADISDGIHK
jgi:hypothetical protein